MLSSSVQHWIKFTLSAFTNFSQCRTRHHCYEWVQIEANNTPSVLWKYVIFRVTTSSLGPPNCHELLCKPPKHRKFLGNHVHCSVDPDQNPPFQISMDAFVLRWYLFRTLLGIFPNFVPCPSLNHSFVWKSHNDVTVLLILLNSSKPTRKFVLIFFHVRNKTYFP